MTYLKIYLDRNLNNQKSKLESAVDKTDIPKKLFNPFYRHGKLFGVLECHPKSPQGVSLFIRYCSCFLSNKYEYFSYPSSVLKIQYK